MPSAALYAQLDAPSAAHELLVISTKPRTFLIWKALHVLLLLQRFSLPSLHPTLTLPELKKDPGIPNLFPFKEQLLKQMEDRKRKSEDDKARQKLQRQREQSKRRSLQGLQSDSQKRTREFEKKVSQCVCRVGSLGFWNRCRTLEMLYPCGCYSYVERAIKHVSCYIVVRG